MALISCEVKCPSEGLILCVCFRVISPWRTFLYFPLPLLELPHLSNDAGGTSVEICLKEILSFIGDTNGHE